MLIGLFESGDDENIEIIAFYQDAILCTRVGAE